MGGGDQCALRANRISPALSCLSRKYPGSPRLLAQLTPGLLLPDRKKEYMSRRMSEMDRLLCERHLFHGTSADVVEGICKHNFDPRVCGKHATMFGQGSYFARKAVYSHNFSKRSSKGLHCMFLAKVLTGRWVRLGPAPPPPPPSSTCPFLAPQVHGGQSLHAAAPAHQPP